jgi:hypothetical protein
VYRAEVALVPASDSASAGGLAALANQFEGISALAGIDLSGGSSRDEAVLLLRSRALVERYITQQNLLPTLFPDDWDRERKAWRTGAKDPPTLGDGYKLFDERIRSVREDKREGAITFRIEWTDRELAAQWANGLVDLANNLLRQRAIAESAERLNYLNQRLDAGGSIELKQAIYRVVEAEIKSQMLASARREFAFRVVDPAVVPDANKRVRPWRTMMVLIGAVVGMTLGIFALLVRNLIRERRA